MPNFTFKLATPFGPSNFTVDYSEAGVVAQVRSSAAGLSATMLKLSYGDRAEQAGNYFQALAANVYFQLEVVPFLQRVPEIFEFIHHHFSHLRKQDSFRDKPLTATLLRINFWERYGKLTPLLFFRPKTQDAALQKFAGNQKKWTRESDNTLAALEPWALTLFDIVDTGSVRLVWEILGRLRTASAADLMLTQLERKGIHPQAKAILKGLHYAFDPDRDQARVLALGKKPEMATDLARPYLRLLQSVKSREAVEVATGILNQQVEAMPEAMRILQYNDVENPFHVAKAAFWETEHSWVAFRYVELFHHLAPESQQITLLEINEKLAQPIFTDSAPVIWQQQLSTAWKTLIEQADADERLDIIQRFLQRPEARLKYNALLQLNYLLRPEPAVDPQQVTGLLAPHLPGGILEQLTDLVAHRFDKVAAQAIAAIRKVTHQLPDWDALNEKLMPISTAPGLRVAKLKLLKTLGERPAVRAAQQAYFLEYVKGELMPDERTVARSIIKYLRLAAQPAT